MANSPSPSDFNRAVRAFAASHRLLTTRREDGEVALRCGRRRLDPDSHVTLCSLDTRLWKIYAYNCNAQVENALRAAGAASVERLDDGMVTASVSEPDLFRVSNACSRTRLVKRRPPRTPPFSQTPLSRRADDLDPAS